MDASLVTKIRLVIMADYTCYCWAGADLVGTELKDEFPEWPGILELQKTFSQWNRKFEQHHPEGDGRVYAVDWESFHKEGVSLCQQLKLLAGDAADIYYWPPFEDVNGDSLGRIHIAADIQSRTYNSLP
jgi:hypothetical protein